MARWLATVMAALAFALAAGCGDDDDGGGGEGAAAGGGVQTVEPGVLTVGSDIPFPPFEYRESGELTGFDVALVEEMAQRLDLRVRWVDTAFDTIFTQLAAGRYDVIASATTITDERQQSMDFTDPYYSARQALTVNVEQTPGLESVEDLSAGDTVAVQRGTTGETWARENLPRRRQSPRVP